MTQTSTPIQARTATAEDTRQVARIIAGQLRPGDLVVLDGPLGAGKTTFTQGIGDALEVRGPIASPTFVLARVNPSLVGGPDLVHVDAYRLSGEFDVDDLDLDSDLDAAVTVVEWGRGKVEQVADSRLEIRFERPAEFDGDGPDEPRVLTITPIGPAWEGERSRALADALAGPPADQ